MDARAFEKNRSFFDIKKLKKPPQKVAYLLIAVGRFFSLQPRQPGPKQPSTSFPFYKFFYSTISVRLKIFLQIQKVKKYLFKKAVQTNDAHSDRILTDCIEHEPCLCRSWIRILQHCIRIAKDC